jgi:hypothetical protein
VNWKEFFKKYWFLIIGLLILVYILFPKKCGYWSVLDDKKCKCYGILKENNVGVIAEGWPRSCYGICIPDCICARRNMTTGQLIPTQCD